MASKIFGAKVWTRDEATDLFEIVQRVMSEDNTNYPNINKVFGYAQSYDELKERNFASIRRAVARLSTAACRLFPKGEHKRKTAVYEIVVDSLMVKDIETPPKDEKAKVREFGENVVNTYFYFPSEYAATDATQRYIRHNKKMNDLVSNELAQMNELEQSEFLKTVTM
jgi:hypothetical protein